VPRVAARGAEVRGLAGLEQDEEAAVGAGLRLQQLLRLADHGAAAAQLVEPGRETLARRGRRQRRPNGGADEGHVERDGGRVGLCCRVGVEAAKRGGDGEGGGGGERVLRRLGRAVQRGGVGGGGLEVVRVRARVRVRVRVRVGVGVRVRGGGGLEVMQRIELVQLDALEHGRAEERAQARQQLRGGDTQRVAAEHAQQHGVVLQLEAREPPG